MSRASELGLHLLKNAAIVIGIDQHRFIQKTLDDAQNYGITPLFLPVQFGGDAGEEIASANDATDGEALAIHGDAAALPLDTPAHAPELSAVHRQLTQLAQSITASQTKDAATPASTSEQQLAAIRQQLAAIAAAIAGESKDDSIPLLTLEEQAALDPFHDKPLEAWDDAATDAADVRVKDHYELKPELDPAKQDPGPLPELASGRSSPFMIIALVLVLGAAAAYLTLVPEPPPTPEELAAMRAEQAQATERTGLRTAEHIVYRARRISTERIQSQSTASTICQRLLDTDRYELAQEVCATAHAFDSANAGRYARALIAGEVFENADVILRLRLQENPDDRAAWQSVAELARRRGDVAREREAIEALLRIEASLDPTEALRLRLEELDAAE